MTMKKFSYRGFQKGKIIFSQIMGIFAILTFTALSILLFSGVNRIASSDQSINIFNDPRTTLICFAFWFIAISWFIGGLFINILPTIWMTEKGLIISVFILFRVNILWKDLIDFGQGKPPKGFILVRAKKITPFHRLYGWLYSHTFYPSFLIGNEIQERDILLKEMKRVINNQKSNG
jgi:hypothetical protein